MITDAFDNSEVLFGPKIFMESRSIYVINALLYSQSRYLHICLKLILMKRQA